MIFALAACHHQTAEDVPDGQDTSPTDAKSSPKPPAKTNASTTTSTTANTCLGKAKLAFDNADCNKCMSDSADCCAATIACFGGDADCAALHQCMQKCDGSGASTPGTTAPQAPADLFASTVFPSLNGTCGACHASGASGAPVFIGADAASTYTLFKNRGFAQGNSLLLTKGQHEGPALTAQQVSLVNAWVADEAAPPATGPGSGTGTGGGNGGGGTSACQDACKAQHQASVTKWTTYNTCTISTCKSQCL
jgi:hypothetical protein